MSSVDIKRLVQNISTKTSVYTPLIEAIVNSLQSIDESGRIDGLIDIYLVREAQTELNFDGVGKPKIISFRIEDNGMGFNDENYNSFDKVYSSKKIIVGGKGFGRFTYLKYFSGIKIESIFKDLNSEFSRRQFNFCETDDFIEGNIVQTCVPDVLDSKTTLFLSQFKPEHIDKIEKNIETISRILVEKLLIYFLNSNCPKITIHDDDGKTVILNDYIQKNKEIQEIDDPIDYTLVSSEIKEKFNVRTFKIYFSDSRSSVILAAHNREVTKASLGYFVPEFSDDFYETDKDGIKRNYIIRSYVLGSYLDENVSLERDRFTFSKQQAGEFDFPFTEEDIQRGAVDKIKEIFGSEVSYRREKKIQRVNKYVSENAPWHSGYVEDINWETLGYNVSDEVLEIELQKIKIHKELESKREIREILARTDSEDSTTSIDSETKVAELAKRITDAGRNDLIHYVCNRKMILELLKDLLKRRDDGSAQLEKDVHNIIFPMGQDTTTLGYEEHNLWLLDERLAFSTYAASDKKISTTKKEGLKLNGSLKEPDLVVFDKPYAFRSGDNQFSNPLTIFEFKRPKRTEYPDNENPITQVANYLKEILDGKYETPDTIEKPKVRDETPVYAFIIADPCNKLDDFAIGASLYPSPDGEGYFGYHGGYKMYIHIYSYRKILDDANLRNAIFFDKLKII